VSDIQDEAKPEVMRELQWYKKEEL